MLKELKEANDLLEEAINGVDANHPNWDIPIAVILNEVKPVAEEICDLDLDKLKRTQRNRIVLEITRSHMLMDRVPLAVSNKE
jgi:hypothetical protein